jgi:hypothetical protein
VSQVSGFSVRKCWAATAFGSRRDLVPRLRAMAAQERAKFASTLSSESVRPRSKIRP